MGKIVAFIGPPGSGKTSLAMKAAVETYCATKSNRIFFVSPDICVPSCGVIFPNYAPDDLASIGGIFDSTDIDFDTVLNSGVSVKSMKDFACYGFKSGENRATYPAPDENILRDLFEVMRRNTSYVFVDCSDDGKDTISEQALKTADIIIRVIPADLKGMTWYATNRHLYGPDEKCFINVVNPGGKGLFYPTDEVCTKVGGVLTVMPYSKALAQQMLDGSLYERLKDAGFNKALKTLVKKILETEKNNEIISDIS